MDDRNGLDSDEAAARLRTGGHNELAPPQVRTGWHIALEVLREPMTLLLFGAGIIYALLGDPGDALLLLVFVLATMGITVFQQRKTERVLEALRALSSPRALVIRGGAQQRVPGREVVVGDLLVLEEGDRIAADATLIECHDLAVNESLLTGESMAVDKSASTDGQDDSNKVHAGSMVVQGAGLARVHAIGAATAIGRIGSTLAAQHPEPSPLLQEINKLVKRFAVTGTLISLFVVLTFGLTRHDWLTGLLAGITLAMSLLPEEFQVVFTVFMALGAWRMSTNRVLTRNAAVIETLGAATVLCVDKTGTLTQNAMTVKCVLVDGQLYQFDSAVPTPDAVRTLMDCAVLACEPEPFDPMERAFHACQESRFPADRAARAGLAFVHEYPLTRSLMAMTHVWQVPGDDVCSVATKGAPEAIARLCRLDAAAALQMAEQLEQLARQGLRVLAVARATFQGSNWPQDPAAFNFEWLGLVGLADPIRPAVPAAVAECQAAGIRVVMITGDYPATALAIAREAMLPCEKVVTGTELAAMDPAAQAATVRSVNVFARILPEQKLLLVNLLKAQREIVAMTGDGVNDAPALKAAHIGISMGERGTDVAREASSMVLLNDDFNAIVQAVALGRRIYDNLRKALTYVIAVHMPIAGMTLLPMLLGLPLAFAPIHIVFMELVINPASAIVFENEAGDANAMRRPPRPVGTPLFGVLNLGLALCQGVGLTLSVALVFLCAHDAGLGDAGARTLAFACLITGNLGLIVSNRAPHNSVITGLLLPNPAQWWLIAGTLTALGLSLVTPFLRGVFHFAPVSAWGLLGAGAGALLAIAWFDLCKLLFRQHNTV